MATPWRGFVDLSDILDKACRLYRIHVSSLLGATIIFSVPLSGIILFISFSNVGISDGLYNLTLGLCIFIFHPLIAGALILLSAYFYKQESLSIRHSYKVVFRRLHKLLPATMLQTLLGTLWYCSFILVIPLGIWLAATLILPEDPGSFISMRAIAWVYGLPAFLALCVIVIPSGWFYARLVFTLHMLLLEGRGIRQSFNHSWQFSGHNPGQTYSSVFFISILTIVLPTAPLLSSYGLLFWWQVGDIIQTVLPSAVLTWVMLILALPVQQAAYTLLYYDYQSRDESHKRALLIK